MTVPPHSYERRIAELERRLSEVEFSLRRNELDAKRMTPLCLRVWLATLNENMGATTAGQAAADLIGLDETDTGLDVTVTDPWDKNSSLVSGDEVVCIEQIDTDGTRYFVVIDGGETTTHVHCDVCPDNDGPETGYYFTISGFADDSCSGCDEMNGTYYIPAETSAVIPPPVFSDGYCQGDIEVEDANPCAFVSSPDLHLVWWITSDGSDWRLHLRMNWTTAAGFPVGMQYQTAAKSSNCYSLSSESMSLEDDLDGVTCDASGVTISATAY